ncbi:MAG TPA: MBL fold metallo-hydrolase [Rhodopila sp.]|uniref:MBL fold metallo-hydrolase n=1 Tax=Rhodopila sp. TaxID=2480087 RepID=UPI002CC80C5B|nr:MBL fold metallo-hydrolase [Rhodopila sp.]HVY16266.1 MBL fold metallo-hydrolase [Rhodopila sp.]
MPSGTNIATDQGLAEAQAIVVRTRESRRGPEVAAFFHEPTNTASYVVSDPASGRCAVIDSVLDYDAAAGRTAFTAADGIIAFVRKKGLQVEWILETHVHADHLSAAPYIKQSLGGRLGIGENIRVVQQIFGKVFNAGTAFQRDGSQFDHLFKDGERFAIGGIEAVALHTPGHTPACMTYVVGDAAFIGDTLFMPDYGTARADFPGGDAATLYRSARRVLSLPDQTRLFLCHDYKAPGRDAYAWETTVAAERQDNVHVHDGVPEAEFVRMRTARDATLGMPKLILPSVQVNMRAGEFPPPEDNGQRYLKIPLNQL